LQGVGEDATSPVESSCKAKFIQLNTGSVQEARLGLEGVNLTWQLLHSSGCSFLLQEVLCNLK